MLSVIVPASNEASLIGRCLEALLASRMPEEAGWQLIVVANGCRDNTATVARGFADTARQNGVRLEVIEVGLGDKLNAINVGEAAATGAVLVYVDADVIVGPDLLFELSEALAGPAAAYGTGTLAVMDAASWVTRQYARFWCRLPFVTDGAPGCGVFAVNRAGRARWGRFPAIISDDTFVRLQFAARERHNVRARYQWPMVEGFGNLVRVRRRQDRGVAEIAALHPKLLSNEEKSRLGLKGLLRLAAIDPVGFAVYSAVALATRLPDQKAGQWVRGR